MPLTRQQLDAALAHALPGAQARSAEPAGDDWVLRTTDGRVLLLRRYCEGDAEPAALLLLATADVPVPLVAAFVAQGGPLGSPYALLVPIEGQPLSTLLPMLSEQQRYRLGREVGSILSRVHSITAPRFGSLTDAVEAPLSGERPYVLARLAEALAACVKLVPPSTAHNLARWFDQWFVETNRPPVLVHGGLGPGQVLVRRAGEGYVVAGIIGWGAAQGWSPAWDHTLFLETAAAPEAFGVRVGYGEGYEAATERAYQQLREHALAPYRMLRAVERAAAAPDEAERRIRAVEALLATLLSKPGDDERFSSTLSA